MDVSSVSSLAGPTTSTETKNTVEKESFLKLLVAQMGNQDPMSPNSSEQYVQQLTQFSSIEQLMNLNQGITTLAMGQLASNSQQAVSFVGKEVVARGDHLESDDAGFLTVRVSSNESTNMTVRIFDESGKEVATIKNPMLDTEGDLTWSGGKPGARYTVSVDATDADGNSVSAETYVRGRVTGVMFDQGYPELMVDGRRVKLADVTEVGA